MKVVCLTPEARPFPPPHKPDAPARENRAPALALGARVAADYLELTKPRVAVLVLFTVAIGFVLAGGSHDLLALGHALLGTALVAAGASALNQLLERQSDARMKRTRNRPLPAGRLRPADVLVFGLLLGLGGTAYLAFALPHPAAALVAAVTFVCYVAVYTPLKRLTSVNTLVGAVPGALPPVIGWAAARGRLDWEAAGLFLILFLWQVPHFLAIAWIYRDDYARAGLRMLPVADRTGGLTGRCMVAYCLTLLGASVLPAACGWAGWVYLLGATALGLGFLGCALGFLHTTSLRQARWVLRASLLYLPLLLALLLLDGPVLGPSSLVLRKDRGPMTLAKDEGLRTKD
jgi:protoheme IX farnesyltransferase